MLTEARSPGSGSTPLVVGWSNSGMWGMTSFISTCRSPAYWLWEVCRSPLAGILQAETDDSAQSGPPQAGCEGVPQPKSGTTLRCECPVGWLSMRHPARWQGSCSPRVQPLSGGKHPFCWLSMRQPARTDSSALRACRSSFGCL